MAVRLQWILLQLPLARQKAEGSSLWAVHGQLGRRAGRIQQGFHLTDRCTQVPRVHQRWGFEYFAVKRWQLCNFPSPDSNRRKNGPPPDHWENVASRAINNDSRDQTASHVDKQRQSEARCAKKIVTLPPCLALKLPHHTFLIGVGFLPAEQRRWCDANLPR